MRNLVFLMSAIVLAFGLVNSAGAQDPIFGLVEVDNAAVRVGPDFAYDAIDNLPRDTSVQIIGRSGTFIYRWDGTQWFEINYGGGTAWIYARLLRTSQAFNSIPPTGRLLPRNRNGRVPDGFDLSSEVCSQWVGEFTQSGGFSGPGSSVTVTFPGLQGANLYRVIIVAPDDFRVAFDSLDTTVTIPFEDLPRPAGTYTWRVAPYWDSDASPRQQVCLLQTGGTFDKPFRERVLGTDNF